MISRRRSLFALIIIVTLTTFTVCADKEINKVLVDLQALPEPFTNDKLPSREPAPGGSDGERCYSLMGCYNKIPLFTTHPEPMDLKTAFQVSYKEAKSLIKVERCDNCLENNHEDCEQYPFDLNEVKGSPFRPDKRTIVIIGGYRSKSNSTWEQNLGNLWSQLEDVNVIIVGWDDSNRGNYLTAAVNTRAVARQLTVLIYYLAKLKGPPGLDLNDDAYTDKFQFVGHSLGAHMAGFVGADLGGRVGRITGLDPAGPSFDGLERQFRIDRTDARLVDILHTNSGSKLVGIDLEFGSALASGHIDLWANNGKHQPGCKNEITGCSHKRANLLYESYLNDALSMRNRLGNKYKQRYRLSAFSSDTFEQFQMGSSLAERCPISTLDNDDLSYADLARCSIPVDYTAWYSDLKSELELIHGLDLADTVTTSLPNNFYFYTSDSGMSQFDHYMIKIRVPRPFAGHEASLEMDVSAASIANRCSIGVDLDMANGFRKRFEVHKYHMIDSDDHYAIILPYLVPSSDSKYEIASLDSKDFYIRRNQSEDNKEIIPSEHLKPLRDAFDQVFPVTIRLLGFRNSAEPKSSGGKKKKSGLLDSIKKFFTGDSSVDQSDDHVANFSSGVDCNLAMESLVIQPLRKFRRHLSAFYSFDCSPDDQPRSEVNVILLGENDPSPKGRLFDEASAQVGDACDIAARKYDDLILSLKTVIIGPLLVNEREDEETAESEESVAKQPASSGTDYDAGPSQVKLWLVLTIILVIVLVAMILFSIPVMRRATIQKAADKQPMVTINSNYVRQV